MSSSSRVKNVIIGQSLQFKRESLSLSRTEVAKQVGVKPQFVANWERGQCLPPKKILNELMQIFKLTKKDLVKLYTTATKVALEEYFENLEN